MRIPRTGVRGATILLMAGLASAIGASVVAGETEEPIGASDLTGAWEWVGLGYARLELDASGRGLLAFMDGDDRVKVFAVEGVEANASGFTARVRSLADARESDTLHGSFFFGNPQAPLEIRFESDHDGETAWFVRPGRVAAHRARVEKALAEHRDGRSRPASP